MARQSTLSLLCTNGASAAIYGSKQTCNCNVVVPFCAVRTRLLCRSIVVSAATRLCTLNEKQGVFKHLFAQSLVMGLCCTLLGSNVKCNMMKRAVS